MTNYYADTDFVNIIYALDIALETYFSDLLLKSTLTRVLNSPNNMALRNRSQAIEQPSTFELPFLNYDITGVSGSTVRKLRNFMISKNGLYFSDAKDSIKLIPQNFTYEATFWCHRNDEMIQAYSMLAQESSNETIIYSTVEIDTNTEDETVDLDIPIIINDFNLELDRKYEERDWLTKNKIHDVSISFNLDTFLLFPMGGESGGVYIPDQLILNFLSTKGTLDTDTPMDTDPQELLIEYFSLS